MKLLFILPSIESVDAVKRCIQLANYLGSFYKNEISLFVYDNSTVSKPLISHNIIFPQQMFSVKEFSNLKRYYYYYCKYGMILTKRIQVKDYDFIIAGYEGLSEIAIFYLFLKHIFKKYFSKKIFISIIQTSLVHLKQNRSKIRKKLTINIVNYLHSQFFGLVIYCSTSVSKEIEIVKNKFKEKVIETFIVKEDIQHLIKLANKEFESEIIGYVNYFINIGRISIQNNQILLRKALSIVAKFTDIKLAIIGREQDFNLSSVSKEYINENNSILYNI